ncbi:MAG: Fur family transcriptional regulator [Candidatus Binatia bacterium]
MIVTCKTVDSSKYTGQRGSTRAEGQGFHGLCRKAGLSATRQRRAIYSALRECGDHPTAETLYARIGGNATGLSMATVYRNLKLFVEAGIIDEVATGSSFTRYDANQAPHHHLVCKRCGSVRDYYCDALDRVGDEVGEPEGFEVQDLRVNLIGICAACRRPDDAGTTG